MPFTQAYMCTHSTHLEGHILTYVHTCARSCVWGTCKRRYLSIANPPLYVYLLCTRLCVCVKVEFVKLPPLLLRLCRFHFRAHLPPLYGTQGLHSCGDRQKVKEGEDPQLEEEDGVGVSSHYWLQLEKRLPFRMPWTFLFLEHMSDAPCRVTTSVRPAGLTASPDPFLLQMYLEWELMMI